MGLLLEKSPQDLLHLERPGICLNSDLSDYGINYDFSPTHERCAIIVNPKICVILVQTITLFKLEAGQGEGEKARAEEHDDTDVDEGVCERQMPQNQVLVGVQGPGMRRDQAGFLQP